MNDAVIKNTPSGQTFENIDEMRAMLEASGSTSQQNPAPVQQMPTGAAPSSAAPASAPASGKTIGSLEEMAAIINEPAELRDASALEGAVDATVSTAKLASNAALGRAIGLGIAAIEGVGPADQFIKQWEAEGAQKFAPETKQGQQFLEDFGEYYQKGMELLRSPAALSQQIFETAIGATEGREGARKALAESQESADQMREDGIFQFYGDLALEKGASPEVATAVTIVPEAIGLLTGVKPAAKVVKQAPKIPEITKDFGEKLSTGVDNILKNLTNEPELVFIDRTGKITPEGMAYLKQIEDQGGDLSKLDAEIASQLKQDEILTPEQAERFNLFQKRGLTPIRSQITQEGDDFMISQELAKGTNPISRILASQDADLEALARKGHANMGGTTANINETNASLFQTFDNVVSAAEDLTSKAYRDAKDVAGSEKVVRVETFLDTVRDNVGNEGISGNLISSVRQDLINKGVINKNDKTFSPQGRIDVNTAEQIRQDINAKWDSLTPQGQMIARDMKDALDADVEDAVGMDIFEDARAAKIELERIKRRAKRDHRDKGKANLLVDILENKIPEEDILKKVLSARDDEFLHVKEFLLNESGPQGIEAWQNLKAQVMDDAIQKAISTRGKAEGGGTVFKGNIFNDQFKGMRRNKKYEALFNPDERELIEDIAELDFLRVPKSGTYTGKGPSAPAIIGELSGELEELTKINRAMMLILNTVTKPVPGIPSSKLFGAEGLKRKMEAKAENRMRKAQQREIRRQVDVTGESERAAKKLKKKQQQEGGQ